MRAARQENHMKIKTMLGAAALLSTIGINQVFAAIFDVPPPSTPPIPEFDGSSAIAVLALLASVVAILVARARSKG
jgi:hypothetical protein